MRAFSIVSILTAALFAFPASAANSSDSVRSAKAAKAIYDKGLPLPQILDVSFSQQSSIPSRLCVIIIYERRANNQCPDSPIGPTFDKGYAACFNSSTDEVEEVIPVLSDESGC